MKNHSIINYKSTDHSIYLFLDAVCNFPSFTNYRTRILGKTFQSLLIQEIRLTKSNSEISHFLRIKALNNQQRWSCKTQDMTHQVVCAFFFSFGGNCSQSQAVRTAITRAGAGRVEGVEPGCGGTD